MAAETVHHVTLRLARDYEFVAEFDDLPAAAPLLIDEPAPTGQGHGPSPADLLGAAVGNCLCASLAYSLRRAHVDLRDLTARVTTRIVRNEKGHHRVGAIEVELSPTLGRGTPASPAGAASAPTLAGGVPTAEASATALPGGTPAAGFEDFCAVTASVRHGIPVTVTMKPSPITIES